MEYLLVEVLDATTGKYFYRVRAGPSSSLFPLSGIGDEMVWVKLPSRTMRQLTKEGGALCRKEPQSG